MPSVGANRWHAMTNHLRRMGHEVTVLTTSAYGRLDDETTANGHTLRTADLNAAPVLRALLRRPPLTANGPGSTPTSKPPPAVLTRVLVPDAFVLAWVPAALRLARSVIKERRVDCLITSSPFESVHLVGLGLGRRRPAWLADFRDGWRFEDLRPPFPTRPQRALDGWLERRVAQVADAVVGVTPLIADDLRARLGAEAAWIPNGWDPDLDAEVEAAQAPAMPGQGVTLVHTGTLSGPWGRDPAPLFDALARLAATTGPPIHLVLAGRLSPQDQRLLARPELSGLVHHVGLLPRATAAALQRRADALVLVTAQEGEATGKLFEYLAAGRPIIALADRNVAARIVEETRTGIVVPPRDVDAIAAALRQVASGELERSYAPHQVERYRFPLLAEALAEQVERAIARRNRLAGA